MIEIITGLPGNAKTLFTIKYLHQRAKTENRQVYYSGIPLTEEGKGKLGWIEIDPLKWMECPSGSIIVIDEAQRVFRNRAINTLPPKYVSDLETHRHNGLDLVFITQMPKLIDPSVRALTERHRHLVRVFGMQASTVHEWNEVREDCFKGARRKDSEKSKWVFDKTYYQYYKSAEVHTHKRRLPKRLLVLAAVPIAIVAATLVVRHFLLHRSPSDAQQASGANQGAAAHSSYGGQQPFDPVADSKRYVFENTARVKGLQYTAPKYDELTKPTRVPMPAACVQSADRCKCYTQQGTVIDVGADMCREIVRNGYFESFDRDGRSDRLAAGVSSSTSSAGKT